MDFYNIKLYVYLYKMIYIYKKILRNTNDVPISKISFYFERQNKMFYNDVFFF